MDWREDRIGSAARGENPTGVAELDSGYAVIGDVQFLPGYCVLLGRDPDAKSLADMPRAERVRFLADADLLATAVERACREADPSFRRTNIEVLGNADAFVHAMSGRATSGRRRNSFACPSGSTTPPVGATRPPHSANGTTRFERASRVI